jgi:ribosome-associated protein
LSDKKAENIIVLDIRGMSVIADYFVIATGTSERQIKALAGAVDEALAMQGLHAAGVEGLQQALWVLMDFGDVIIHIFSPEQRDYYRLERLWSKATPLLVIQ